MHTQTSGKRLPRWLRGSLPALLCLLGAPGTLLAQERERQTAVEEVIVTGTFIRREDSFDTANPIDLMSSADIAERGTPNLGEIIRQQPFNFGVDTVTNILAATPNTGSVSQANVRGLGVGATLTLLDGRRTITQNAQALYPQIAIDRVETMTDGGAALYGTDAVAAVVNLIPRRRMEGLELRVSYNAAGRGDWDETVLSGMFGVSNGDTGIGGAVEWRARDELKMIDRGRFARAAVSSSGEGNPGSFRVPVRDPATGQITAIRSLPDPGCGLNNFGTDQKDEMNNFTTGFLFTPVPARLQIAQACRREFGEDFNYIVPQDVFIGLAFLDHRFNDMFSFEGEFVFSRQDSDDRGSASNPGGRIPELPTIPGEHPGNPFRAMTLPSPEFPLGRPLFARDAGDGTPARDAQGNVILADDPFNPAAGVPFNEDVRIAEWRPVSKLLPQPTRNHQRDLYGEGDFTILWENFRWAGRLNFDVPNSTWIGWLDYTYHKSEFTQPIRVESLSAMQDGLLGRLTTVIDGQSQDVWFNPFSTQMFQCVDRVCAGGVPQQNPEAINRVEALDRIALMQRNYEEYTMNVVDLVFTGGIFDLPAGSVGLAVGGQMRYLNADIDYGPVSNARDAWIGFQALDWEEDRTTWAGFAEVEVPLYETPALGRADVNLAVRTERGDDNSQADLDSTNWKFGIRVEPRDWIALRASAGTAFIAPTLANLFEELSFGLSNVSDPLFGRPATFKSRSLGGNPLLASEEADTYNMGFTLRLLGDDLAISGDWKIFFFDNRISRPIPQDVIFQDFARFNQLLAQGAFGGVTQEEAREIWIRNNPNQPGHNPALPGEDPRIRRDVDTTVMTTIDTPLQNVSEMTWRGGDFAVAYRFNADDLPFVNRDFGRFRARLMATYVDSFSFKQFPGQRSREAAGNRNNATGFVPPIPRWQGTLTLGWDMDRHAVAINGRYRHHMREDDTLCALPPAVLRGILSFVGQERAGDLNRGCARKIRSMAEWDAQYRFSIDGLFGARAAHIEVGAINLFDTFPIPSASLGGMETLMYDPRGRQLYLRLHTEL
jgi:iron complex outermembrane recepter protein